MHHWQTIVVLISASVSTLIAFSAKRDARQANKESARLTKQVNNINLRLLDIEEDRKNADLQQAKFDVGFRHTKKTSGTLGIKNVGLGSARNIRISVNYLPIMENWQFSAFADDPDFDGELTSGKHVEFRYMRHPWDKEVSIPFSIRWQDDLGKEQVFNTDLENV